MNEIRTYSQGLLPLIPKLCLLSLDPTYFSQILSQDITLVAFDSLELRCQAIADSRLRVDYIWTMNGRPVADAQLTE